MAGRLGGKVPLLGVAVLPLHSCGFAPLAARIGGRSLGRPPPQAVETWRQIAPRCHTAPDRCGANHRFPAAMRWVWQAWSPAAGHRLRYYFAHCSDFWRWDVDTSGAARLDCAAPGEMLLRYCPDGNVQRKAIIPCTAVVFWDFPRRGDEPRHAERRGTASGGPVRSVRKNGSA